MKLARLIALISLIIYGWVCFIPRLDLILDNLSNATGNLVSVTDTLRLKSAPTLSNIQSASQAIQSSAEIQARIATTKQNTDGLQFYMRAGKEFYRFSLNLNNTLDKLQTAVDNSNNILTQVNEKTIPNVTLMIDRANNAITLIADDGDKVLKQSKITLEDIHKLLTDKDIQASISNIAAITDHVKITVDDIQQATPEIISEYENLMKHTGGVSEQVEVAFKRFNKPVSKAQKILGYMLQVVAIGAKFR